MRTLVLFCLTAVIPCFSETIPADKLFPEANIFLLPNAPASVHLAARELQDNIKLVTNTELPIISDPNSITGYTIYLGDTDFARSKGIFTDKLPPDGFNILSGNDFLILAGKDYSGKVMTGVQNPFRLRESYNGKFEISAFGDCGTLFATYYFLEKYCGIRWYMPGPLGIVAPKLDKLEIPTAIDIQKSPAFEERYPYFCMFSASDEDALWYRRAGFGCPFPNQIFDSFAHFFLKYKDTHPEYFALIGGQRDFTNLSSAGPGNFNLSNPDFIKQVIKDVDQYFDDNPEQKVFPLCPPDGMKKISEDPASQAQVDWSRGDGGQYSNYVFDFVNKVAIGVAKKHPDKLIGCLAYNTYCYVPTNIEHMNYNISIMICKLRRLYLNNKKQQEDFAQRIAAWKTMAPDNLYAWEYYCDCLFNPDWQGYPSFYPNVVQEDLKALKGVTKGEFIEAESWTTDKYTDPQKRNIKINYPGLQHPLLYVTARLLWDPDLDLNAMLNEYYHLFYGPAEQEMGDFWKLVEKSWQTNKGEAAPSQVFTTDEIASLVTLLNEAQAKVPEDSVYRKRIDLIKSEFKSART